MKIKYLVLLFVLSVFCTVCLSCNKNQSTSEESTSTVESVEVIVPEIAVNQNEVTISVGDTFTLIASAENVEEATFTWSLDGESATDVVDFTQEGNTALITAVKVGQVKLIASITVGDTTYYKTVNVEVKQVGEITLVLSENIGFNNNGYFVKLSTLQTDNGDATSVTPIVTAYKNNKIITASTTSWQSQDEEVVSVSGNVITSVSEGATMVMGSCDIEGVTYTVSIEVEVYRPIIEIEESFVVEVEHLSSYNISSTILGNSRGVEYNGEVVGSYDMQSKLVSLDKASLPTSASHMGEGREFSIQTNLASYVFTVDLYTKIIKSKSDFDNLAKISKACSNDTALWDGYFVLGADVEYNGLFQSKIADMDSLWSAVEGNWYNGCLYGFKGVIDGKGHKIVGLEIDNGNNLGAFVGVLHVDGVIKNITFTDATVCANSSLVCGAGGGRIENIYIQYKSLGKGVQKYEGDGSINTHTASFFGFKEPTATASVSNCIIDATNATFDTNSSIKLVGMEYVTIKNVFVIGGTQDIRDKSNATSSFESVIEFIEDENARGRYAKFDGEFWSLESGAPISNLVYNEICGKDVNFIEELEFLAVGTQYKFLIDNEYVSITADSEGVAIRGGVVTVLETATLGQTVTFTATSIFDSTKRVSFAVTLISLNLSSIIDLTQEETTAFYDLTEKKVYLAELGAVVDEEILYYTSEDLSSTKFSSDDEGQVVVFGIAQDKIYKIICESVTKVIDSADDLHHVRRNYTVSSYGHSGCYDGVITGKFVVINDIDCSDLILENSGTYWENSRGFGGLFDGRGYTISNLTVSKNGLFGTLSFATIQNVTFEGVKLTPTNGNGEYVALFANSVYNTTVENVSIEFVEYVNGESVSASSGLMFHEKSFDSTFVDIILDISNVSGVKFLTEYFYNADLPKDSYLKPIYENVTVIVANSLEVPPFAYADGQERIDYPAGITIKDTNGNVLQVA